METFGAPNLEAFMGGVGVGLSTVFFVLLLVGGANLIRRIFSA